MCIRDRNLTAVSLDPNTGDARRASPEWEKACWKYRESNSSALAASATCCSTSKQEPVRENRAYLSIMSIAAVTVGASPLEPT